jgi:hypothetical protein
VAQPCLASLVDRRAALSDADALQRGYSISHSNLKSIAVRYSQSNGDRVGICKKISEAAN